MTPSRRNEVRCRACSELLGTLSASHVQIRREPNVATYLYFGSLRIDLMCPNCGTVRVVHGKARNPHPFRSRGAVVSSDAMHGDCERAVG